MRSIINYFIMVLIFWVASQISPETINFTSGGQIFLTSFVMIIFSVVILLLLLPTLIGLVAVDRSGCLFYIFVAIIAIACTPILLWVTDKALPGFSIHGFWTYLLVSIALGIFNIRESNS